MNTVAHEETFSKTILGFWFYLMTDCVLFATLFITHAVLYTQTFGGPAFSELFTLPLPLAETIILLVSSICCGFAMLAACRSNRKMVLTWITLTFLLGLSFVILEFREFHHLVKEGNSWQKSASLSSFFTLVGTHGIHISVGLLWILVLTLQILKQNITISTFRRLACFTLFWHFLDLIWIFIFTFVYLQGMI